MRFLSIFKHKKPTCSPKAYMSVWMLDGYKAHDRIYPNAPDGWIDRGNVGGWSA